MIAPKLMAMFPEQVVRNSDGSYYHPAYTAFCAGREWISYPELENWLTAHGLEYAVSQFDQEPDTAAAREYASTASFTTWDPEAPSGDGWFIAAIYESEDGPECVWVRSNVNSQLDAALNTIREAKSNSGCPDGVDLQEHLKQLVVEGAALKHAPQHNSVAMLLALDALKSTALPDVGLQLAFSTLIQNRKTPALNSAIRAIKAQGVEMAIQEVLSVDTIASTGVVKHLLHTFATQLRQEAQ